jgi:2-aminomuconate deaminase
MIPTSVILTDCAQPLANYPHAKKIGNILYLSGISAREPSGKVRGVSVTPNGEIIRDVKEQTRGVIEKYSELP